MKLKFIYALAIMGAMATFSSCRDDDDPEVPAVPGSSLEQKTFSSQDGLALNLNGAPLIGKTATFTPGTDGNATITLAGEPLDISQIMGMITKADNQTAGTLPTAGVLPGSPSVSIPVVLNGDADNCTFEGSGETEYCTYSYEGSVASDSLKFNLSDVKLKNTSLAGTWTIPNLFEIDPWGDEVQNVWNVARLEWDSPVTIDVMFPMPVKTLLALVLSLPTMNYDDEFASLAMIFTKVFHSVTFEEDGTLTAKYVDTKTGETTESPVGIAQYVITSEGNIRLYLNPAAIIANSIVATKGHSTRAIDLSLLVENLMQQLVPMLSGGIPISYGQAIADQYGTLNEDPNVKSFYLETETLLPLLKVLAPIFTDEEFVKSLVEEASKDPTMGSMADTLSKILNVLPEVIDTTTKIEIGINLKK